MTRTLRYRHIWKEPYFLLLFSTLAVLVGRAIQLVVWDAPFRVILWDEAIMTPILLLFNISWGDYIEHSSVNVLVEVGQIVMSLLLLIAAIISINLKSWHKNILAVIFYWSAVISLVVFVLLLFKDRHYQIGKLIEYALQVGSPVFLWIYVKRGALTKSLLIGMLICTAMTFIGHGMYAYGYHPVPGHFQQMVMNIFGMGNEATLQFLKIAGFIDFVLALMIFIPKYPRLTALVYMVIWGFLTSLARLWANFPYDSFGFLIERWLFEFIYRFPHFIIPFLLLVYFAKVQGSRQA